MTDTWPDETNCRGCGNELREGDDVVEIGGTYAHHDCVAAHNDTPARKILQWAGMGARNQLCMGDVQRGE
jgi:hypothetical protein